jgi:hypothetical protein
MSLEFVLPLFVGGYATEPPAQQSRGHRRGFTILERDRASFRTRPCSLLSGMLLTVGLRETCPNMSPPNQAEMPRLCHPAGPGSLLHETSLPWSSCRLLPVRLPRGTAPYLYAVTRPKIWKTDYSSPSRPRSDTCERGLDGEAGWSGQLARRVNNLKVADRKFASTSPLLLLTYSVLPPPYFDITPRERVNRRRREHWAI